MGSTIKGGNTVQTITIPVMVDIQEQQCKLCGNIVSYLAPGSLLYSRHYDTCPICWSSTKSFQNDPIWQMSVDMLIEVKTEGVVLIM